MASPSQDAALTVEVTVYLLFVFVFFIIVLPFVMLVVFNINIGMFFVYSGIRISGDQMQQAARPEVGGEV